MIGKGARVVALDANEKMLAHAKKRNGNRAQYILANLEKPLSFFENSSFNGIVSALAITYVKDHLALFKEFNRILRRDGWFVFSTEHPFFSFSHFGIDNYFATKEVNCDWKGFGKIVNVKSYYHSLGSITEALNTTGFDIELLREPLPTEEFRLADPQNYKKLCRFPLFICMRAKKR
jgi:ubiquinone/menaquinone biosynthesis C-methylase UbiE